MQPCGRQYNISNCYLAFSTAVPNMFACHTPLALDTAIDNAVIHKKKERFKKNYATCWHYLHPFQSRTQYLRYSFKTLPFWILSPEPSSGSMIPGDGSEGTWSIRIALRECCHALSFKRKANAKNILPFLPLVLLCKWGIGGPTHTSVLPMTQCRILVQISHAQHMTVCVTRNKEALNPSL